MTVSVVCYNTDVICKFMLTDHETTRRNSSPSCGSGTPQYLAEYQFTVLKMDTDRESPWNMPVFILMGTVDQD